MSDTTVRAPFKLAALRVFGVFREAAHAWAAHDVARMGAALAYYTAFSVGPILLIALAVAGLVLDEEAARDELFAELRFVLGDAAAFAVQEAVKGANRQATSIAAMVTGIAALIFGAGGVFRELHDAMNVIWGVELRKRHKVLKLIRERFVAITLVLGTCFLLIVSLLASMALAYTGKYFTEWLPGGEAAWQIVLATLSLFVTAVVFSMILHWVPDVRPAWRASLIGGGVTALLFALGEFALGIYLGKAGFASRYGAAGSLIIFLVWVFYSAQILYFGAELSRAITRAMDLPVQPGRSAARILVDEDRLIAPSRH